jgi:SAM-dependent methyltransferase
LNIHKKIVVGLWEAFRSRIFKFGFSRYYNDLISGGAWRTALLNEAAPRKGARVLQVHIQGSNISGDFLAKYPGCSLASVNPLDPAPEAIEGIQHLLFEQGRIGCEGASFDKVVCCMALHPLAPPAKLALLKEMRRVLRARGTLHLADLDKAFSRRETLALIGTYDLYGQDTAVSHSDGTWTAQIELAGFSHVKQVYNERDVIGRVSIFRARR